MFILLVLQMRQQFLFHLRKIKTDNLTNRLLNWHTVLLILLFLLEFILVQNTVILFHLSTVLLQHSDDSHGLMTALNLLNNVLAFILSWNFVWKFARVGFFSCWMSRLVMQLLNLLILFVSLSSLWWHLRVLLCSSQLVQDWKGLKHVSLERTHHYAWIR